MKFVSVLGSSAITEMNISGAHHALAEVIWVDARQSPHEQG